MPVFPRRLKVYLAGGYEIRMLLQTLAASLFAPDIVTSTWLTDKDDQSTWCALRDAEDIDRANALFAFYPFGVGTSSEISYAFARKLPVFFCVDECNMRMFEEKRPWPIGIAQLHNIQASIYRDGTHILNTPEEIQTVLAKLRRRYAD